MLAKRAIVAAIMLPVILGSIVFGGIVYTILISAVLGLAAWELVRLFKAGGYEPSVLIPAVGAVVIVWGRFISELSGEPLSNDPFIIGLLIIVAMVYHLIAYERGRDQSATDFVITIGGAFYIGILGSYLFSMRYLPDGMWWLMTTLFAVWLADSGAYFYGKRFGKRKLTPRLSPKKTWEGYIAGIVAAALFTPLFALLWAGISDDPISITPLNAGLLALVLSIVTPLGDLGESMFKRQFGIKDSSNLLPGHGGIFDRIDSWIWAGFISFYLIPLLSG